MCRIASSRPLPRRRNTFARHPSWRRSTSSRRPSRRRRSLQRFRCANRWHVHLVFRFTNQSKLACTSTITSKRPFGLHQWNKNRSICLVCYRFVSHLVSTLSEREKMREIVTSLNFLPYRYLLGTYTVTTTPNSATVPGFFCNCKFSLSGRSLTRQLQWTSILRSALMPPRSAQSVPK